MSDQKVPVETATSRQRRQTKSRYSQPHCLHLLSSMRTWLNICMSSSTGRELMMEFMVTATMRESLARPLLVVSVMCCKSLFGVAHAVEDV